MEIYLNTCVYVCVYILEFIYPFISRWHLLCFNFLTIMRNAAKNRCFVYKFVCEGIFSFLLSGRIGVEYLAHMVNNFWSNFQCFPEWLYHFTLLLVYPLPHEHFLLYIFFYCYFIPDHLICLLRNLYSGQEATVRTGHGTTGLFQIGKGVCQGGIVSPCLFNLYAEYITRNAGLEETQAGIKIARRNINNLRYADDTTLMAESEEEPQSLLKVKEEWKSWLKTQHSEN